MTMLDASALLWLRKALEAKRTALVREGRALARRLDQLKRCQSTAHEARAVLLQLNRETLDLVAEHIARLNEGDAAPCQPPDYTGLSPQELAALTHEAEDASDDIAFLAVQAELERRSPAQQEEYRRAWVQQTGERLRQRGKAVPLTRAEQLRDA